MLLLILKTGLWRLRLHSTRVVSTALSAVATFACTCILMLSARKGTRDSKDRTQSVSKLVYRQQKRWQALIIIHNGQKERLSHLLDLVSCLCPTSPLPVGNDRFTLDFARTIDNPFALFFV
jgi:hypothetical protein